MTNTLLLEDLINKKGIKKSRIIKELNLSYSWFNKKLNNEKDFKAIEIQKLCNILDIDDLNVKEQIFFANKVGKLPTRL